MIDNGWPRAVLEDEGLIFNAPSVKVFNVPVTVTTTPDGTHMSLDVPLSPHETDDARSMCEAAAGN